MNRTNKSFFLMTKFLVLVYTEMLKPPITCVGKEAFCDRQARLSSALANLSPVHHVLSAHRMHLNSLNAINNQFVPKALHIGSCTQSTSMLANLLYFLKESLITRRKISPHPRLEFQFLRGESLCWGQTRPNPHSSFQGQSPKAKSKDRAGEMGHALSLTL